MATRTNGDFSLILSRILDNYGLDEENRKRRMDCQKILGPLLNFAPKFPTLLSGSAFETTTINGLSSDIDIMNIVNDICVIDDIQQWKPDMNKRTYMMDNTDCYKAFVKLNRLSKDYPGPEYSDRVTHVPFIEVVDEGKIWLRNTLLNEKTTQALQNVTLHGPAVTKKNDQTGQEIDCVFSFICQSFPKEASGWKERQTNETRAKIGGAVVDEAKHCYLVGVGNKGSPKEHLEWRLSFSHIENQLIHNWNNIQYKCYVMMKFINKDLIKPFVPDVLCSYHFKTIVMWMVEECDSDFFIETNFENCLLAIIRNLSLSVRNKSLPHYFVEGCNLFYNKLNDETRNQVTTVLENIIHTWPFCLFNIERRGLGIAFSNVVSNQLSIGTVCNEIRMERRLNTEEFDMLFELMSVCYMMRRFKTSILQKEPTNVVKELFRFETQVKHTEYGCTKEMEQYTSFIVKDVLCCVGLQQIYRSDGMSNKSALHYKRSGLGCIDRCSDDCGIDTRLEIAGHFTVMKNYNRAITLLDKIEKQIKSYTWYYCIPEIDKCDDDFEKDFKCFVFDNNPSVKEFCKYYIAFAIEYKQDRIRFVPSGLVYEKIRTTAVSPAVSNPKDCDWYNHAVVHCLLYLYYLRFLCYDALGRYPHRQVALDNMIWASEKLAKFCCIDIETNHNLVGYCFRSIGRTRKAYKKYKKSLSVKKYHNAAIWHLAVLLRSKIRRDR